MKNKLKVVSTIQKIFWVIEMGLFSIEKHYPNDKLLFYTKVTVTNSDGEYVRDKFEQSVIMNLKDIE